MTNTFNLNSLLFGLCICLLSTTPSAQQSDQATLKAIAKAVASEQRPDADIKRDTNRLPEDTLNFFGLRKTMTVVELIPGGGWYTRILAPTLRDQGKLYLAYGTGRVKESVLGDKGFDKVVITAQKSRIYRPEAARNYVIEHPDLGVSNVDMVLTFRNYHNFAADGREAINEAAFRALKPGGIYGVVDHTRRHMEPDTTENRRRIDPVLAIKEIEAAGFEFVDFSDLHYRPSDNLALEVGHETVTGQTDRWTLKFRKPL
ncbi:putative methyltransferase [Alteromonadaceae bacterium 2753L.S.0a.02]|nr:putative methyltransferase [Alteromonadaceae bacterium 2753L.S.0a.02]